MINFFVDRASRFGMRDYLANRGTELAGRIGVFCYEDLANLRAIEATGTIFAGIDQAGPATRSAAACIHDQLSSALPAGRVLNHPVRSLQRYPLLQRLFEIGCNRFTAIRATDEPGALRYPVFVRYEHRHNGSLTPLLHDRRSLDLALGDLTFRGVSLSKLLVVEFCDTADGEGLYRKYSAMRIGDVIIPRHLHASRSWIAKATSSNSDLDEPLVREELAYLETHPHERWLRHVFNEAQIEYGRVDYGVYQGEPQVWEINTNPTLGRGRNVHGTRQAGLVAIREPARRATHRQILDALKRLEVPEPAERFPVLLQPDVCAGVISEARGRRRMFIAHSVRRGIATNPVTQALKGIIRPVINRVAPAVARLVRSRHLPKAT